MIKQIELSIRAWHTDGKSILPKDLLKLLSCTSGGYSLVGNGELWQAARIILIEAAYDESTSDEPGQDFCDSVAKQFSDAVVWLESISLSSLKSKGSSLMLDVLIELRVDSGQIDLCIPSDFMKMIGDIGLPMQLISND